MLRGLEDWLNDGSFVYRNTRPTQTNIVIIGIDGDSLDRLAKPTVFLSPELGKVILYAKTQHAAAIGNDLIIPEKLADLPELIAVGEAAEGAGNVVLPRWQLENSWLLPVPQWRIKEFNDPHPLDFGFVNLTEDKDQFVRRQMLIAERRASVPQFALALY